MIRKIGIEVFRVKHGCDDETAGVGFGTMLVYMSTGVFRLIQNLLALVYNKIV